MEKQIVNIIKVLKYKTLEKSTKNIKSIGPVHFFLFCNFMQNANFWLGKKPNIVLNAKCPASKIYPESVYFCPSSSLSLTCPIARTFKWLSFSTIMSHSSQSTLLLAFRLIFVPFQLKTNKQTPSSCLPPPHKKEKLESKNPEIKTHKELVDMCLTLITWDCGCLHMSKLRIYTVNTYSSLWKTNYSK